MTPATLSLALAEAIAGAPLFLLPRGGHNLVGVAPDRWLDAVRPLPARPLGTGLARAGASNGWSGPASAGRYKR